MIKKIIFTTVGMILMSASVYVAFAQTQVTINPNIPGVAPTDSVSGIVANFYTFALAVAGILALGAITFGGIKYAVGKGNPSAESEGKSWITNALLGLFLLGTAYLILYTVNPQILSLNIPGLTGLRDAPITPVGGGGPVGPGFGCGGATSTCAPFIGVACKNGCSGDPRMAAVIACIQQKYPQGIRITEAMPPSSPHQSTCHNNGCCVDMTPAGTVNSCTQVSGLIGAARACGAQVLNEYFQPVGGQSCEGTNTEHSTGNHLHVVGC